MINIAELQPSEAKVAVITGVPALTNETELKSFLRLENYYAKFLHNHATVLAPLYQLLWKEVKWQWKSEQETAFEEVKELLNRHSYWFTSTVSSLSCWHVTHPHTEWVPSYRIDWKMDPKSPLASRMLTKVEQNYSQLDKEALAIIFGVKHFHKYIYGWKFTILTDHKPLLRILSKSKATSPMASARLQRWSLLLGAYHYCIQNKSGLAHANADALSQLPLRSSPVQVPLPPETIQLTEHLNSTPVTVSQIRTLTGRNPLLSKVKQFVQQGWPQSTEPELNPFAVHQDELSIEDGCLHWGGRFVVPPQIREEVMHELHEAHPGIARMKSLAHHVWWQCIDADLKQKVKTCKTCQPARKNPAPAPLHRWEWPR